VGALTAQAAVLQTTQALAELTKEILGETEVREQLREIVRAWMVIIIEQLKEELVRPAPKKKGK